MALRTVIKIPSSGRARQPTCQTRHCYIQCLLLRICRFKTHNTLVYFIN